ncbi:PH domain-containing protein [Promethearchaeum syntrophicum]|uniref:PH domain-containing protein n=1 Tax=Promethearchaeum syntrophicum TaxID=2594042 RepID=A0A5B9D843_9ARCH|nr:PH domain-containing protein [Candidatus Prometheoarchaeum syntrophicum]QEE15195.1 Bacterial membrane flanked domain protein [Candidatus Prometheoarchaeum syntrophicum]
MEPIPSVENRQHCDDGYLKFLNRILPLKLLVVVVFLFLCGMWAIIFAYEKYGFLMAVLWTVVPVYIIGYPIGAWYNKIQVKNHWWYIGNEVIMVHNGVFSLHLARIPYDRIQNMDSHKGFFDRIGGFYRIQIQTAGSSINTKTKAEGVLFGVREPEPIIEDIFAQMECKEITKDAINPKNFTASLNDATQIPRDISNDSPELIEILLRIEQKLGNIEELLKT